MKTQYATRTEVIDTVNTWAEKVAPEFALTHLQIHGESITHFRAVFHYRKLRLDVTLGIVPTANNTGWYAKSETMWSLEEKPQYEWEKVDPYPAELEAQHPKNEDDEEYWKNDDLPYSTIVHNPAVMNRINADMHDFLVLTIDQLDTY